MAKLASDCWILYLTSSSAIAETALQGGGVSFGKNISAKIEHLISLYPTALTSTNHHFTVLCHLLVLNAKFCNIYALNLEVFEDLNLVSLSGVFWGFLLNKCGLIFKSLVATLPH